ncbi:hypothetical protein DZA65_01404 [Dickeya dianthicola]|uniref:hypothetical protein n=1 Tax=Dickeya dianthicola TaxID=204039 RepID=UPI000EB665BE|nr:hypothetical protein [Dickeya dianthicola]AYC18298.1 hypothetical protein DZA65_01404 [Dickeya dianthicola]MCI4004923.1 hypothetical protein [Dickeya dianthicola]MCI4068766.1 hypothetical protein [Dickeya dianthicola]MCI4114016.1 hypothetical protein [Dickeya dianthicola]MCI4119241.1 hypothetical protein [Dickeya dianthicola]
MPNPFTASWSRNGNLLCHGHWIIHYQEPAFELPEKYREQHLGTLGIYSVIDPDDELYREGRDEDDWILENVDWLADSFELHQLRRVYVTALRRGCVTAAGNASPAPPPVRDCWRRAYGRRY